MDDNVFSVDELKDIYERSKPSNLNGNTEIFQNVSDNCQSILLRISEFLEKNDGFHSLSSFLQAKYTLLLLRNIGIPSPEKKEQEETVALFIKCKIFNRIIEFCKETMQNRLIQSSLGRGKGDLVDDGDCGVTGDPSYTFSEEEFSYLLFLCCQLLTNFASLSSSVADHMLSFSSSSHSTPPLLHLLACIQHYNYQNGKSVGIFWHLIFILFSSTSTGDTTSPLLSPAYRPLLCSLFLTLQSLNRSSSGAVAGEEERNKAATNEWSQLLMLQIMKQKKCCHLFQLLNSTSLSSSVASGSIPLLINAEQVRKMFFFVAVLLSFMSSLLIALDNLSSFVVSAIGRFICDSTSSIRLFY
jgi:hypothetical protein